MLLVEDIMDFNTDEGLSVDTGPFLGFDRPGSDNLNNAAKSSRIITGTWIPTISGATSGGTGTYGSLRYGSYSINGSVCLIALAVTWTAHTGVGGITISNLPFLPARLIGGGSANLQVFGTCLLRDSVGLQVNSALLISISALTITTNSIHVIDRSVFSLTAGYDVTKTNVDLYGSISYPITL